MKFLTDTNALLWAAYAPERLTKRAASALLHAELVHFSIVNLWEIALKLSRGGYHDLDVPMDWETSLMETLERQGYHMLSVKTAHCRQIQDLPFHHKDPFDRMLIAQAMIEKLDVIGSNEGFDDYPVRRIW